MRAQTDTAQGRKGKIHGLFSSSSSSPPLPLLRGKVQSVSTKKHLPLLLPGINYHLEDSNPPCVCVGEREGGGGEEEGRGVIFIASCQKEV